MAKAKLKYFKNYLIDSIELFFELSVRFVV